MRRLKKYFFRSIRVFSLFLLIAQLLIVNYLPVFALNDTLKTWNFTSATAGDYTYDSNLVTVDDNGAHPVSGVNKITNPAFASDNSSWSVAANPPSGWVEVPGSGTYSTENFLVMKYEAKCAATSDPTTGLTSPDTGYNTYADNTTACTSANSRQVVSVTSGYPIANITHPNAVTRCSSVGLNTTSAHLITNAEWMTIARDAEAQDGNWTLGTVGSGYLFAGHNDNSPAKARIASTTDTGDYRCAYTDGDPGTEAPSSCPTNTANGQSGTAGNQVRTLTLSNDAVVWDLAGNVWEHIKRNAADDTITDADQPDVNGGGGFEWNEFTALTSYGTLSYDEVRPADTSYDATEGVGRIYHCDGCSGTTQRVFLRGGYWRYPTVAGAFTLGLHWPSSGSYGSVGLRCASDPVAISQSYSSSSGRGAAGGNTVITGSVTDAKFYQSINVGDTSTYDFSAYVYDNTAGSEGGTVDATVASLYYGGNTVSNAQYTAVSGETGWYKLTGTITGFASSVETGLLVKADKTVIVDDFTLSKQGTYSAYNTTAYSHSSVITWDSFSDSVTASGNAAVYYQICLDDGSACSYSSGSRWQYYTAGAWANSADATTTYTNTAAQLTQTAMQALPVTSQKISVKAIMVFGGADTPSIASITVGLTTDATAPTISLTALSPDPTTDNTPSLSGTAVEAIDTVSSVEFQMDGTSGSWTACTADDGAFDEASEAFTCAVSTALSDSSHTIYVRATDSNNNTTASGSESTDTFTIDATAPASFSLDSPGHENYSNSERPTFKWKAASTPDATSGLSKYKLEIDNGDSGDFTIDDIPVSRTTDYSTNKYLIHYENFDDSDSTNNYISVYAKSSSDWGSGENDGKLKEGKRYWKVKAVDNAGNEREESRTLFVDRSGPSVETTQVNDASFADNLATTDKTPTIYGKITDSLSGDSIASSAKQNSLQNDNKVASGPKEVEIKFEKRNYLGVYSLHTLATVNINDLYWSSDASKITDNSKQTSNKYSSFSYTSITDLPLGTYKITLTGKDKASNGGGAFSFALTIKTFEEIVKIPEVEKVIEELEKEFPKEEIKEFIKEQGIVVPEELKEPSKIAGAITKIFTGIANLWWKTVDTGKFLAGKVGQGLAFVTKKTGQALAFAGNQIKNGVVAAAGAVGKTSEQFLAFRKQKIEETKIAFVKVYSNLAQKAPGVIGDGLLAIGQGAEAVNKALANAGQKIADTSKTLIAFVKKPVEGVGKPLASIKQRLAKVTDLVVHAWIEPATKEGKIFTHKVRIVASTFVAVFFDKEPTKIADIQVEEVSPTTAVVYWQTNHYATSKVNYGFSTTYGEEVFSNKRVKEHRMVLKDLEPGKLYYFEVMSQNKNYVYDAYYTFNTPEKEEEKVKGAVAGETLATITADEGSWVVVRSEPSLRGEILAKVAGGQTFPLLEEKDGWVKIKLDGQEGWVFGELIKIGGGGKE